MYLICCANPFTPCLHSMRLSSGTWDSPCSVCHIDFLWYDIEALLVPQSRPMGALFALFSDWSIFKRTVLSSCTSCGLCVENCGMGAIGEGGQETREGECVLGMTCQKVCPETALPSGISYRLNKGSL